MSRSNSNNELNRVQQPNIQYTPELTEQVLEALQNVRKDVSDSVYKYAQTTNEMIVIQQFNQSANDLFDTLSKIIKKYDFNKNILKIDSYRNLFNNAISSNAKLPLDKYTLTILLYAENIYNRNDDMFLSMTIPDTVIKVGNEFEILSSDSFKEMWKKIDHIDKNDLKDVVYLLTYYSHCYFIKRIMAAMANMNGQSN